MRKKNGVKSYLDISDEVIHDYTTTNARYCDLADKYNVCITTIEKIIHLSGTKVNYKRRVPRSEEHKRKIRESRKNWKMPEDAIKRISETKSSKYNGLNGYGHTKKKDSGYIIAHAPKHPYADSEGYVRLHRIIMEQYLGRYLTKDEVVHHINHIKDDNRIENLIVMNKHEHKSMHAKEYHENKRNKEKLKND